MNWTELWQQFWIHIEISLVPIFIATAIALLTAIAVFRYKKLSIIIINLSGLIQTIPSLAFFGLLLPFVAKIQVVVIITLSLYAFFPIVSNAIVALQGTRKDLIDVSKSLGMSNLSRLFKIRLRMGISTIISGIRISTILVMGTTTIAAVIGAGGLGDSILTGINRQDVKYVLMGTIPIAIFALLSSFALLGIERLLKV